MTSSSTNSGFAHDHGHLRRHARSGPGARSTCRTASRRRSAACRPKCARIGVTVQQAARPASCWRPASTPENGEYDSLFLSNYIDVYVKDALKRVPGVGDVIDLRRAQLLDARCGSIRSKLAAAAAHRRRRRQRAARAERAGRGRRARPGAGAATDQMYQFSVRADGPAAPRPREFDEHHRQGRRRRRARPRSRTSAAPSSAPRPTRRSCASRGMDAVGFGVIQLPSANALDVDARRRGGAASGCRSSFPPGLKYQIALQHDRGRRTSRSAKC